MPLILGINVGASSPVLFSMFGGTRNGKRTAWSYLISNILCIPIIYILYIPLRMIFGLEFMDEGGTVLTIALLNTAMRVLAAPFLLLGYNLLSAGAGEG